jgi:hypothetical protein
MPVLRQDQLNLAQAEAVDMVQPHSAADNLGKKSVPGIRDGFGYHYVSLAYPPTER